jgi:tetraprenyl-beta-curcumene synthase
VTVRTPALGPRERLDAQPHAVVQTPATGPRAASPTPPANPVSLVWALRREVLPRVRLFQRQWRRRADAMPPGVLHDVATESLRTRRFHCEGLASYALLAEPERRSRVLDFTVAFQTMVDYLDGLADRLTALDPRALRRLHEPLMDAVDGAGHRRPYRPPPFGAEDADYLERLVTTCVQALADLPGYPFYAPGVRLLVRRYAECQAYKRLATEAALRGWALREAREHGLEWYELAAAANSTLTVHCLVALASLPHDATTLAARVLHAYFPAVQVLGVLLDNLIDRAEDDAEGHLNFCRYFPSDEGLQERLEGFLEAALSAVAGLPDAAFHRMIIRGHVGLYRWDPKVRGLASARRVLDALARRQTPSTRLLSLMGWYLRRSHG